MPAPKPPAKKGKPAPKAGPKTKTSAPPPPPGELPTLTVCGVPIPPEKCLITRERNLELLGWEAEPAPGAFGEDYTLIDQQGKHVRLLNNTGNREYKEPTARQRMQDFLNGHWRLNGETAIFSVTDQCLSYQHRGVGYELAWQRWEGWQDGRRDEAVAARWRAALPHGPQFYSLQVYGVPETPDVVRTIDCVRERTDADVIYTSGVFAHLKPRDRSKASAALAKAVALLWHRVGQDLDAYNPLRTNSEVMDFVGRHPRLVEALTHVVQENAGKDDRVKDLVGLGTAAGLLYLMGSCGSAREKYLAAEPHSEAALDWKYWKRAKEFWTALAGRDKALEAVFKARYAVAGEPADPKSEERRPSFSGLLFNGGPVDQRIGVLVKAWNEFGEGNRVTPGSVKLEHADLVWNPDGTLNDFKVVEYPSCGGIDSRTKPEEPDPEVTPAEAEEAREEIQGNKDAARRTAADKTPGAGTPEADLLAFLAEQRAKAPGAVILFKGSTTYRAQEEDADKLTEVLGFKQRKLPSHLRVVEFDHGRLEEHLTALHAAGLTVAVSEPTEFDEHGVSHDSIVTVLKRRPPRPLNKPAGPAPAPAPVAPGAPAEPNGTTAPAPAPKAGGPKLKKRPVPLRGGIGS